VVLAERRNEHGKGGGSHEHMDWDRRGIISASGWPKVMHEPGTKDDSTSSFSAAVKK
jgi:hypothetical protein